jgi:hypothetical protein
MHFGRLFTRGKSSQPPPQLASPLIEFKNIEQNQAINHCCFVLKRQFLLATLFLLG